jgi:hypothetical protein
MPRSASGVYTLPAGNPVVPGTTIDSAWANTTMEDLGTEITNSLSRTGAGGMLVPFRIADGLVTGPGLSFLNETNTGLYRSGAGSAWMAVLGVNTVQFSTVGMTIPSGKALTAQGATFLTSTLAVTGATTMASTLVVTGAVTATGGVVGNVTGNVTSAGTSNFAEVVISGSLDMTAGSAATITGLSNPTNASDAANKGYVDTQDALKLSLTGGTMTGAIAMSNTKITGLATPTADQDAATKAYVDSVAQGLDAKASCRASTTANITLSGAQTIDGVAVIAGDRVLVQNQTSAAQNGIYVAAAGAWARSSDASTWDSLVSAFTFIESGTVNGNNGYICTIAPGGTLGTTPVTWAQFSGAGQITAGTGMSKTGNTLNVNTASSARIVVGADEIDLATTGVTASTYKSVTVDAFGRVTAGTNPTTLAGYGISDAYTTAQVDAALALKLNLTGGTMSGVIAMGANKITGLADPTVAQDAATKNYIDTIFGSTTTAAASAAAAASSASAASTSASNAATSATASAGSATSSAASYTTFNNQYLGSKASDPTVNNTGGALVAGNLYWNSTVSEMRVYSGSAWVAAYLPASGYLALTGGTMTGAIVFAGGQTFPGTGDVTLTGTQTLTNKTLTAPTLTAPVLGTPTSATLTNATGLPLTTGVTGQLPVANGGTGTATPSIVAGTNVTVTGTWPNQTIAASGGGASAATPTALGTVYGLTTAASLYTTALGYVAGGSLTGVENVALGAYSQFTASSGTRNTAVGVSALYSNTASNNSAFGNNTLQANTTGASNSGFGFNALYSNTTASFNTAVGHQAAYGNSTGEGLTVVGRQALYSNTTGSSNVAIGRTALFGNTTGIRNVAVGNMALESNTTSSDNVAVGHQALYSYTSTDGTNTAVGYQANTALASGYQNTAIGWQSLYQETSGYNNTGVGWRSLPDVTTGLNNTSLGSYTGRSLTSGAGCIFIGYNNNASSAASDSEFVISTASITGKGNSTAFISPNGGGVYQGNNAATWSVTSDQRLKKNIVDNNIGLEKLTQIQVRNFEYRLPEEVTELPQNQAVQKTGIQLGVIAQELQVVLPDCVKTESTGVMTVDQDNLTWYLINAVKELKAELDAYKALHP